MKTKFYIEFIKEIEKHPALYNRNLPEYTNRRDADAIWKKIASKFDSSPKIIKRKWKIIRSSYVRSLATVTEKSGTREYYLAKYLNFLNGFVQIKGQRPRSPNGSEDGDETEQNNSQYAEYIESDDEFNDVKPIEDYFFDQNNIQQQDFGGHPGSSKQAASKKPSFAADDTSMMELNNRSRADDLESREEPCRMFMLSLVPHMKTMTPQQQLLFQKRVLAVIEEIKYGETSETTTA